MGGCAPEQARELASLSRTVGRQIGLLIHNRHGRQGRPFKVLVGGPSSILIPELPRLREGGGRLRGLRFVHTHLTPDLLSEEDCMDLLFLRLDSVGVYSVDEWGEPLRFQHAHLLPPNPEKRSYLLSEPQRWDTVSTDFPAEAEALEAELARGASGAEEITDAGRRAVLVSVSTRSRREQEAALAELAELARSAGLAVAGSLIQRVHEINPRHILGKGKLAELEVIALQGNAGIIVFDGELSPAQLGNLAEVSERRVLDRTQLILDIFAQRALSRAGRYQVELAQLQYMLPRLVGKSRALDRLAGGIGGRGPGETKLETDRRRLRDRVAAIKNALKSLRRQRAFARDRRAKGGVPVASLVGYTNAGKSTLLNALTGSEVMAEDKLFATLDPTTRRLRFPEERELILTDTVGFIRNLPKELVEAFSATLEELEGADILLHVADASHPELERQIGAVNAILTQLGLDDVPRMLILNKIDALPDMSGTSGASDVSGESDTLNALDPAGFYGETDTPAVPATPDAPGMPMHGRADAHGAQKIPDAPAAPGRLTSSGAPVTSAAPGRPRKPDASDDAGPESGVMTLQALNEAYPDAFFLSARSRQGLAEFSRSLESRIDWARSQREEAQEREPAHDGGDADLCTGSAFP